MVNVKALKNKAVVKDTVNSNIITIASRNSFFANVLCVISASKQNRTVNEQFKSLN